ncbi:MAG: C45 family peptidase [Promethearchaeia archaeon]
MKKSIKVFQLEGSEYDMGLQQGTKFQEAIHQMYKDLIHSEDFLAAKPFLIPKFLFVKLAVYFSSKMVKDSIKTHLPSQWEFLEGLSEGAQLSMKRILFLQAIDALGSQVTKYKETRGNSFPLNNCSAVGITPNRTDTGGVLIIKNWDGTPTLAQHIIFRKLTPTYGEKYATLGSSVDGLGGINNGVNEKGLSMVYSFAYPLNIGKKGIPPMFLIREVLEHCTTVKESIQMLKQFPRLGGANMMIADRGGDLAVVETSPTQVEVRRKGKKGESDFLIATNHYVTPVMKQSEVPRNAFYTKGAPKFLQGKLVHRSSILRYKRTYNILKDMENEKISLDFLNAKVQSDHGPNNMPSENTFCNHGEKVSTGFGIMMDMKNNQVFAVYGNPCQGSMENLTKKLS